MRELQVLYSIKYTLAALKGFPFSAIQLYGRGYCYLGMNG